MITAKQLQEALEFFDYNIGEGVYDETILVGLDDQAKIDLFEKENDKAEYLQEAADEAYALAMFENAQEAEATGN